MVSSKSPIIKGAIISYVAIFMNIAITFFYTPWMIRKIGVSDYGLYCLVYSFISYFILDFGLSQAIQRFIAKYRAEEDEDKVAKMIGITTRVYIIIDSIIFIVLLVLFFFISNVFSGLTPIEVERMKGLYIIAGVFSILSFMFKPMGGAMMAYEFFVEERVLEMLNKVGAVAVVCIALFLGADVYALVLINGAMSLIASFGKFWVFRRKTGLHIQWGYYNKAEMKGIFSFSMWTFGRGLAQRLRFSLVVSLLGIFCNTTEIAVFSLGMSLEGMIYTLSSAINGLFMPKVARLSVSSNRSEILSLMIRVGRIELYIIGFLFSAFLAFGQDFLRLWVGEGFTNVYYVVLCLIFTNLVSYTEEIAENLVYIDNKIRYTTTIILICSVLGFVSSIFIASKFGAVGCAVCAGTGLLLNVFWANVFYYKKMDINIICFFKACHIKILPLIILISVLSLFIKDYFPLNSWLELIIIGVGYTLFYWGSAVLLLFNVDEKQLVKQLLNRK